MRKRGRNITKKHLDRARMLRREMSVSEKWLWTYLRSGKIGFKFRRQHMLGDYVLDFYCAEALLNVEVDGEQHRATRVADRRRDKAVAKHGILTLRIPSVELFAAWERGKTDWHRLIVQICEERTGHRAFEPKTAPEPSSPDPFSLFLEEKGEGELPSPPTPSPF